MFGAIQAMDLPLLLRTVQGLLGAYLSDPAPGILVTTQRPMAIQRLTAAHELGHFTMRHEPSLNDESILRRMPMAGAPAEDFWEVEADAFAIGFMTPRWLIQWHAARQGWAVADFRRPNQVYQLALRLGASYEATCSGAASPNRRAARTRASSDGATRAEGLPYSKTTGPRTIAVMSGG